MYTIVHTFCWFQLNRQTLAPPNFNFGSVTTTDTAEYNNGPDAKKLSVSCSWNKFSQLFSSKGYYKLLLPLI